MVRESEPPQPFYSEEFKEWADFVLLRDFNMEQDDITQTNCCNVFRHLVRESETSDEESDSDWIELYIQESYTNMSNNNISSTQCKWHEKPNGILH